MSGSGMDPMQEQAILAMADQIERALDDELDRVDNMEDDELKMLRNKRVEQLREMHKRRDEWMRKGHGQYHEITNPSEFFDFCTNSERVICHFKRRSTLRCEVADKHLSAIAKAHYETLFCHVDVERLPALAEKFGVVMLPTIMLVEKKNTFHSIIGFDEFGGTDDFDTKVCEGVLAHYGMLNDRDMFDADQSTD